MDKIGLPPSFIAPNHTLQDEFIIRGIKLVDICYVSVIYLTFAFVISKIVDYLYGEFDPIKAEKQSIVFLYIEVVLHFSLLGIITYVARNLVEQIPFPLNQINGYNHLKLRELSSASSFSVILILFQTNLHAKLTYLANRISQSNISMEEANNAQDSALMSTAVQTD